MKAWFTALFVFGMLHTAGWAQQQPQPQPEPTPAPPVVISQPQPAPTPAPTPEPNKVKRPLGPIKFREF